MRVNPISGLGVGIDAGSEQSSSAAVNASSVQLAQFDPQQQAAQEPNAADAAADNLPVQPVDLFPQASTSRQVAETPGDAYWGLIRDMDQTYRKVNSAKQDISDSEQGLSVQNLLEIHRRTLRYSVMVDFASKVTDRLSQGIQTLMRNQ